MCFKILNFFGRKSVFLPSNLLYNCADFDDASQNCPSEIFTLVGTYVQRGSKFCFVVLVVVVVLADTLIRILHYCPISPCFQHIIAPLHTALRALARQPCTRLPGSLARACPAALHALARQPCARCCPDKSEQVQQNLRALLSRHVRTGSDLQYGLVWQPCTVAFAWQPCPVALPASLARQTCPTAVPASVPASRARQPCRKVCKLFYGRRPACMHAVLHTFTRPAVYFKLSPQLKTLRF
jgi:hypothetical protein